MPQVAVRRPGHRGVERYKVRRLQLLMRPRPSPAWARNLRTGTNLALDPAAQRICAQISSAILAWSFQVAPAGPYLLVRRSRKIRGYSGSAEARKNRNGRHARWPPRQSLEVQCRQPIPARLLPLGSPDPVFSSCDHPPGGQDECAPRPALDPDRIRNPQGGPQAMDAARQDYLQSRPDLRNFLSAHLLNVPLLDSPSALPPSSNY